MKIKLKYLVLFCLTLVMFNCETDDAVDSELSNYVGFEISSEPFRIETVEGNTTSSIEVAVYASEVSSADRSFGLYTSEELHNELILERFGQTAVNNNVYPFLAVSYQLPNSVTIPAGSNKGTFVLSITDDENLGFVSQYLPISFVSESGKDFADPLFLRVTQACLDTIVTLSLELDTWPDETTWEIYDLSGAPTVIFSGGPYANPADDFAELDFDFCLASGQYGVVVYDSYGDGGPTYTVTSAAGILVPATTLGGFSSSATFTVD